MSLFVLIQNLAIHTKNKHKLNLHSVKAYQFILLIKATHLKALKMAGKLKVPKDPKKDKFDKARKSKDVKEAKDDSFKAKNTKDKDKKAPRRSKKKKSNETKQPGSQSSQSESLDAAIFEDHVNVLRIKGKKVSKECEEAVLGAVSDFFDSAWMACAERFFITSAPVNVSYELRNTWLRILEAEYQDTGIKGKVLSAKINRVFHSDEPPLPLAFDTWSRGAVELLPRVKRESVLDPFLREFDAYGQLLSDKSGVSTTSTVNTMDSKPEVLPSEKLLPSTTEIDDRAVGETENVSSPSPDQEVLPGETWNFELDEKVSANFITSTASATSDNDNRSSLGSNLSDGGLIQDKFLHFLFSTGPFPKDDSVTEIDSTASSSKVRSAKSTSTTVGHFSPGQCGGRNGSGIFRLYGETTSEALLRLTNVTHSENEASVKEFSSRKSDLVEKSAEEHQDIVHVSRKGDKGHEPEDELEVHPLFEDSEHLPRPRSTTKTSHRLQEAWRRTPYSDTGVDEVASDLTKEFTTRRLLDLHGRFRRQALRSIAARIKAAAGGSRRNSLGLRDSKSGSSIVSGSNKDRRKSDRKSTLHSVSNQSLIMRSKLIKGDSQMNFVNRPSIKGTVSAPQLTTHKNEPVNKQQKFPLRTVQSKRPQPSFARDKSQPSDNRKRDKTNSNRSFARGQSQSPHNPKKSTTTPNRNLSRDKSQSPHNNKRDKTPTRSFSRGQSQSPHNPKKSTTTPNRNLSTDKSQSPHSTKRYNTPTSRNFSTDRSQSPHNTKRISKSPHDAKKDNVSSGRNIQTRDNARLSRSLTSKLPARKFMEMGNVRSSNKTELMSKPGKSESSMRQTPNQFQFRSENTRNFEPGSIEIQGKPWKKVQQEEPCDRASTTSDCSIKASLERVR